MSRLLRFLTPAIPISHVVLVLALLVAHSVQAAPLPPKPPRYPTPIPSGWPQWLQIPRIGVHAPVVPVTNTDPKVSFLGWNQVGWWKIGVKPGAIGHAYITGHLDSYTGQAVFWNLHLLHKGDVMLVRYKQGEVTFQVQWTAIYPSDAIPVTRIWHAGTKDRELVLSTCIGTWRGPVLGYDHKFFVDARRIIPVG